jgi:class 3 adenylate cyclase
VIPDIRYARTPEGIHIAYQVFGEGAVDLVWPGPAHSNLESVWRIPSLSRLLRRFGRIARVIVFDPRGIGLSDRIAGGDLPTLENRMTDTVSVMEAAGSERAALLGHDATGPLAILFAATYPERTAALVVYASYARGCWSPDYPWAWTDERWDGYLSSMEQGWGNPDYVAEFYELMNPSAPLDRTLLETLTSYFRLAASPGDAVLMESMERETDIRHVLPAVHVPSLVVHRTGDQLYAIEEGRYLAEHIPGARFVELPGRDHSPWEGDTDALLSEIDRFLRSVRDEEAELDRVLATVLFTDIVGSTERAAKLGDHRWKGLLAAHHERVRGLLARYRGQEVKTVGDGFLATFDGPARAIRCAGAVTDAVHELGIEVRAGLHTGEVQLAGNDVRGIAVHIGARVAALAGPGEVLVSSTVKDLVAGSGMSFEDRGEHGLIGVPGIWRLYAVERSGSGGNPEGYLLGS